MTLACIGILLACGGLLVRTLDKGFERPTG